MLRIARTYAVAALALSCASPSKAPAAWEAQYGARADCRGSVGTECFHYSKLKGRDPHLVCDAESLYPANSRRSDCYGVYQVADRASFDPERLAAAALDAGPDRDSALGTLFYQTTGGDAASRQVLRRLVIEHPSLSRRAEAFAWLAEHGDAVALEELARGALDPSVKDAERVWLPQLARLRGPLAAAHLLEAAESSDPTRARAALDHARTHPDVPRDRLWRAALASARRLGVDDCKQRLAAALDAEPRATLVALASLIQDPTVGATASGLVAMALGTTRERAEALPEARLEQVRIWARAGRLPTHLPGLEDDEVIARSLAAREAREERELRDVRIGAVLARNPDEPTRLYASVDGDRARRPLRLLAEIRDPLGTSRWLLAETSTGQRAFCDPLPGTCHPPSWLPPGEYLVFTDGRRDPLFSMRGTYSITFETPFRGFRSGPVELDSQRPRAER